MSFHNKLKQKLVTINQLKPLLNVARFKDLKIVFTNGCFDILHLGHVDYLNRARDLGGVLVVGLNTDDSVKRQNKSPERPINDQITRATILSALECVNYVITFNEETPYDLIKSIQPDILVKGNDYKQEEIVGFDIVKSRGGEIITIPLVEGFSTTTLVQKMKGL